MNSAIEFVERHVSTRFERGLALLREEARTRPAARDRLADVLNARGTARLVVAGEGEVFLHFEDGTLTTSRAEGGPVQLAVGVDGDVARVLVSEAERQGALASDELAMAAARSLSARWLAALGDERLRFHLVLRDTPDFEQVTLRVALNEREPPETPTFVATLRWEDLAALRDGRLEAQDLVLGGRLKLSGDYARALALAMELG